LEAKHHPQAFKVSSARLQNIIRPKAKNHPPEMAFFSKKNGEKPQNRGFGRGFIEGLKA
jgi:hypothetical protein